MTWRHAVAPLVPAGLRERWLEEWKAETWCALQRERPLRALRRCLGAPRDALWTRSPMRGPSPDLPSSPRRGIVALMQDLRYALRGLRQRPAFSLTATLMLALGLGATTGLYGAVRNYLVEPLPWDEPDRLVALYESRPLEDGSSRNTASLAEVSDWRDRSESFDALAPYQYVQVIHADEADGAASVVGAATGWQFFRTLGLQPFLGRDFEAADDLPGADPVVIVSQGFWQERLGGDPGVIGRAIRIDRVPHTVIGVLPDTPAFYFNARVWVPLRLDPARESRGRHMLSVVGRLQPGVGLDAARAELAAIAGDLEQEYPDSNEGHGVAMYRFHDELVQEIRPALLLVLALAAVVLLIVCVNLASMQLASALVRQREVAVRLAIGAIRTRVLAMLLIESLALALGGATLGLLLARATVDRLVPTPRWQAGDTIDLPVFVLALGLALTTSLVVGLVPALRLARQGPFSAIRESGRAIDSGRTGIRGALVVIEVAMAVVLVVGAGLLLRSLAALTAVDLGFGRPAALAVRVDLPEAAYPESADRVAFFRQLTESVSTIPGVRAAGVTDSLPLGGSTTTSTFVIEGGPEPTRPGEQVTVTHVVMPGYFQVAGVALRAGRLLGESDSAEAEPVVVVNEEFVRRYLRGESPLGARIDLWGGTWHRIVGVVASVRHRDVRLAPEPEAYFPAPQVRTGAAAWLVLDTEPGIELLDAVRERTASIDPAVPITSAFTLAELVDRSVASARSLTRTVTVFGSVALLVAAMGLYGVVAYAVGRRRGEIGLRLAMGSTAASAVGLVVRQGMALVAAGLAVGIGLALVTGPLMADLLFGVGPTDLPSLFGAALVLAFVALGATLLPASRAARIDPAATLRAD